MRLLKLNFVESPPTGTQFIRTFDFDIKNSKLDRLAELTDDGTNITPERMARVGASLLTPQTKERNKIISQIDNGWDQRRIMFSMVVEISSRPNNQQYEYIVGHTDYDGFSLLGGNGVKLDNRMKLYFDQITHINLSGGLRRDHQIWTPSIKSSDLLLNRDTLRGFGDSDLASQGGHRALTKRPADLMRRQGAELNYDNNNFAYDDKGERPSESNTNNTVGTFTQSLKFSARENNSATEFLVKTLGGYVSASTEVAQKEESPYGLADDRQVKLSNLSRASRRIEENDPTSDRYLQELRENTRILNSGFITYGELMEMNPEFVRADQETFAPADKRKDYRHSDKLAWRGDDNETIAAYTIASSLPGILIGNMYSKADKLCFNSYGRNNLQRVTGGVMSPYIHGLDTEATWPNFEHQISNILVHEVNRGGIFEFEAKVDANVDGWIDIWIKIDGGPESFHSFPAWGAATASPTLDTNVRSLADMSKNITTISHGLAESRMGRSRVSLESPLNDGRPSLSIGGHNLGGSDRGGFSDRKADLFGTTDDRPNIQPAKKSW